MSTFRKVEGKAGKITYHYRWKAPFREEGQIVYRDVERSTGTGDIKLARQKAKFLEQTFIEAANRVEKPVVADCLFAEAALLYTQSGLAHASLPVLINEIGAFRISEIDQTMVLELCARRWPGCKASSTNRTVFTPILAVVNFAAECGKCQPIRLKRPDGHDKPPALAIPSDEWFAAVTPLLSPEMRAVLLLLTLHGLRVSEAIKRVPGDIDVKRWTLSIPDTKNGKPVLVRLSAPVIAAIDAMPNWREKELLFGTSNDNTVRKRLRRACEAAGVPYYGTHAAGRHSFATRLLARGHSIQHIKVAGRWATERMVCQRYGHLEQSEVADAVNKAASACSWLPTGK